VCGVHARVVLFETKQKKFQNPTTTTFPQQVVLSAMDRFIITHQPKIIFISTPFPTKSIQKPHSNVDSAKGERVHVGKEKREDSS